jgi:hypothetical protein
MLRFQPSDVIGAPLVLVNRLMDGHTQHRGWPSGERRQGRSHSRVNAAAHPNNPTIKGRVIQVICHPLNNVSDRRFGIHRTGRLQLHIRTTIPS